MSHKREGFLIAGVLAAGALLLGAISDAYAGDRKRYAGGAVDAPALYHNYCSVCHGDNGDGNSRAKGSLVPPPTNFNDPATQGKLTREYIAAILRHGKPGTAMTAWTRQLSEPEIVAVSDYVQKTFVAHAGDVALRRGRTLYGHYCVNCHGVTGTGIATDGSKLNPPPRDLTSDSARKELTRERLVSAVAIGKKGTSMNGFAGQMPPQDIEAVVDYLQKWVMTGQSNAISGVNAHAGREGKK